MQRPHHQLLDFIIGLLKSCKDERAELNVLLREAVRVGLVLPPDFQQWLADGGFRLTTFFDVTWVVRPRYVPTLTSINIRHHGRFSGWGPLDMSTNLVSGHYLYPNRELCQAKCDELHDRWYCDLLNDLRKADTEQRDKLAILLAQLPAHELIGRLELVNYDQLAALSDPDKQQALQIKQELIKLALYRSVPGWLVARLAGHLPYPAIGRPAQPVNPSAPQGRPIWLRQR